MVFWSEGRKEGRKKSRDIGGQNEGRTGRQVKKRKERMRKNKNGKYVRNIEEEVSE
jgi:hypothetical protein